MSARIFIGTSGWHYDHWKGPFYPPDIASNQMLEFYAEQFVTAEINNSFYQLPKIETLKTWRDTVPEGFIFSVKASRYLTHMKKLKDPRDPLKTFLERIAQLSDTLGPILLQLPPNWRCNVERLKNFLQILPDAHRYAFEFRDPSWHCDTVYQALEDANVAFCIYELSGYQSPREVTSDFVYIRLHGPAGAYEGSYEQRTLSGWAGALTAWSQQGKEVFCYFDNDQSGFAARNALSLKKMFA